MARPTEARIPDWHHQLANERLQSYIFIMKKGVILSLAAGLATLLAGCALIQKGPVGNAAVPAPAQSVDLERYLGRWYELARYEARFQRGCEAVTADYSLQPDGMVRVLNSCHQGGVDGKLKTTEGKAQVVPGSENAKLRVSFFGPFYGNYWVLDHDPDYQWSIVGEPSGRYLWLLSRTPHPTVDMRRQIEVRAAELGYDLRMLRRTQQP